MSPPAPLSTFESFICGGLAACTAVCYFNDLIPFANLNISSGDNIESVCSPFKSKGELLTKSLGSAEVAKTRLQLQGELAKTGTVRVYTSAVDVLRKTWRNEGLKGIQRGLVPGYFYQVGIYFIST